MANNFAKLLVFQPRADSRLNVIGITGQGKSHFRDRFQRRIYRCTLWNPMGDFDLGQTMTVDEYRENLEGFRKGSLRVTVVPTQWDEEGLMEEFDACCAYAEEIGAQHFEVEEIALVTKPNSVPPRFTRLCIRGRHRAVSLGIYGQRFHQFPIIARGQSSEIVAFRQQEPDDVDDFEARIFPALSPMPINVLPDHHFIHWTPERGAVFCSPLPLNTETQNADVSRNPSNSGGDGPFHRIADPNQGSAGSGFRRSAVHKLAA